MKAMVSPLRNAWGIIVVVAIVLYAVLEVGISDDQEQTYVPQLPLLDKRHLQAHSSTNPSAQIFNEYSFILKIPT